MNTAAALSCFIYMETKATLNKLEHTQHLLLTAKTVLYATETSSFLKINWRLHELWDLVVSK